MTWQIIQYGADDQRVGFPAHFATLDEARGRFDQLCAEASACKRLVGGRVAYELKRTGDANYTAYFSLHLPEVKRD